MRKHNTSGDGKSKPGSIFLISYKRSENGLLVFCGNSAAVVLDGNHQPFIVSEYLQCDPASFADGFHGVFNQINKYLFESDRISVKIRICVIQLD